MQGERAALGGASLQRRDTWKPFVCGQAEVAQVDGLGLRSVMRKTGEFSLVHGDFEVHLEHPRGSVQQDRANSHLVFPPLGQ